MAAGGKKLIIGNLKMNLLRHEFDFYCLELRKKLQREIPVYRLGLAIPYIYLERVNQEIGSELQIFSQDVHHVEKGAYTSSISAPQLSSINVYSTLIGHSECRLLGQSEEIITKKVRTALINGFNIVYCCGKEPLREIKNELFFLNVQHLEKIIIAFEPITAIGSGVPMASEVAAQQLGEIRKLIIDMWGEPANKVRLLYGGSVNKSNYKEYLKEGNIDGILVGSAALNIHDLWDMAMER